MCQQDHPEAALRGEEEELVVQQMESDGRLGGKTDGGTRDLPVVCQQAHGAPSQRQHQVRRKQMPVPQRPVGGSGDGQEVVHQDSTCHNEGLPRLKAVHACMQKGGGGA